MTREIVMRASALACALFLALPLIATVRAYRLGCRPVVDTALDGVFLCGVTFLSLLFLALAIFG